MIIVLDNLRSIHNVASIFRTADGAGCTKVICCGTTPAPLDPFGRPRSAFIKVSLGAEKNMLWEYHSQTFRVLEKLRTSAVRILALEQDVRAVSHRTIQLSTTQWQHTALVLGGEVRGLSPAILRRADDIIEIPMHGEKESLNVTVAFGIVAFALRGS